MSHACFAIPQAGQPCRWCTHFDGVAWGDPSVAWCAREASRRRVVSQPERGCAFYLRLTGVDDDWEPPGLPGPASWPIHGPRAPAPLRPSPADRPAPRPTPARSPALA